MIDDKPNLTCTDTKRDEKLCIFNDSKTWIDNREQCEKNSGKLLPYFFQKIEPYIENSKRYSLGAFRSFEAFANNALFPTVPCLSITRVDGTLWLEPDNCLEKRRYLCKNDKSTDEEEQDDGCSSSSNGGDGDEVGVKKSSSPAYTSEIPISTETKISYERKITTTHPTNDEEEQDDDGSGSSNGGDGDKGRGKKSSSPAYTSEIPISTETKISYERKISTMHPTNDLDDINNKSENNKNGYITILSVRICLVVAIIAVVIIIAYVKRREIQKCYINRKNTSNTQVVIKLGRKTSVLSIENHSPDSPHQEHYAEIDIHNTSTSSETNDKNENEYDHVQHETSTTVSKNAKSHGGQYNIYDRSVLRVTDDDYDTLGDAKTNSRNTEENMYSHTIDANTRLANTSGLCNTLGQTTFLEINIDSNDYHKLSDVARK
ncbi:hypothetical protein DPMN_079921 [Dreissena polymorpha]|uniref:Uncharacterized protein n=1 Tax=Dreissena polymorpha TaxID=45954 RepID=A0A9D3YTH1_DREPO|nr:hypothetical protein DPMN_079921 [Dreissena polymorpha]